MILILLVLSVPFVSCVFNMQLTENITNSILMGYDKSIRPSKFVHIYMQPQLLQILSINEKEQTMLSSNIMYMNWVDPRLSWNYNATNISKISIPAKNIWLPDLYILNSIDSSGFLSIDDYLAVTVHPSGNVVINIPMTSLKTRCSLNIQYFPFDSQTCDIKITMWNLEITQHRLLVLFSSVDLRAYKDNSIWTLTDTSIDGFEDISFRRTFDNSSFVVGYAKLMLKRKPLYFIVNGIIPAIVLNVVNIISFFLPFEKQIELTITCFLTFSVNLIIVAAEIPVQSDNVPTITMYFLFSIIFTLIGLLWFTFLNYFSTRNYLPLGLNHVAKFPEKLISYFSRKKIRDNKENVFTITSEEEKKAEFENMTSRLNYYFLILFLIFMIVSLLCIWLGALDGENTS
jgi:nicotinic acetylcholine receptor, invertebrate